MGSRCAERRDGWQTRKGWSVALQIGSEGRRPELGTVVPTFVSREAWEVALAIDREVEVVLLRHGVMRSKCTGETAELIAKMVQLAINRTMDRVDA